MSKSEIKIKTVTKHTYITVDGRSFDNSSEAEEWQGYLDTLAQINMLDYNFEPAKSIAYADYVFIKTDEQREAFNNISSYWGYAEIDEVGCYCYEDDGRSYENIDTKISKLQSIIDKLKGGDK